MSTSAVLVNFNGYADTLRALQCLIELPDRPDQIIVVDNGSHEDEAARLEQLQLEDVVTIRSPANLGFAGGCNLGIRRALQGDCASVLLLNNDAVAQSGCIEHLRAVLAQQGCGVACPLIVDLADETRIWAAGGLCIPEAGIVHNLGKGQHCSTAQQAAGISFASGCALLVRREVFETVGLLPERWFLYFEDVEFSLSVTRAGWHMAYVPEAIVQHAEGSSARRGDVSYFFYWRNYLLFLREYARGWSRVRSIIALLARLAAMIVVNLARRRTRRVMLLWRAALAGLRGDWSYDLLAVERAD